MSTIRFRESGRVALCAALVMGIQILPLAAISAPQAAAEGQTYHPQNVADFSWFAFDSPSKAQHKAYSFPDETTLPALSPANLLPGCVPAP